MIDGLGLVYEKRGNTGAAAYEGSDQRNPFAEITQDLKGQIKEKKDEKVQEEKETELINNRIIESLNPEGWSVDNKTKFYQAGLELKKEAAMLGAQKVRLNDMTNPQVLAFQEKQKKLMNEAALSKEQGGLFDAVYKAYLANPNKYDKEKTLAKIEKFKSLPFEERVSVDPRTILETKYRKFAPIENIKNMQDYGDVTPKKGTQFNEKRFRAYLEGQKSVPEIQESIQQGIDRGDWVDVDGWADAQTQQAASKFQQKADQFYRPTIVVGGYSPKQIAKSMDMTQKTSLSMKGLGGKTEKLVEIYTPTDVTNVDLTLNPRDAYFFADGRYGTDKDGLINIKSGTMGLALKYKDGEYHEDESKPVEITENGKKVKISVEEAVKRGILTYTPAFFGKTNIEVEEVVSGSLKEKVKKDVDIIFNPSIYKSLGTGLEPKARQDFQAQIEAYKEKAKEKNAQYKTTTPAGTSATNPTSSTVKPAEKPKTDNKKKETTALSYKDWKAANGDKGTIAQYDAYKATFKKK